MLGPVVIDVAGAELTADDVSRLQHPQVGGAILFARNYATATQLRALTAAIHAARPGILLAVDHEGGRVQRFREGFTPLPPMRALGRRFAEDPADALATAQAIGCVMACELVDHGLDFSFAPVLDLDHGESGVIGDRAFGREADLVASLATALHAGAYAAGMNTVGKHFPGHGYVRADSHLDVPVDERAFSAIEQDDLIPFARLAKAGMGAVMPAHVVYPAVDAVPAGFSARWLKEILRGRLQFDGMIFSDDLGMEGARTAGGLAARAHAALEAGCDMVLLCNDSEGADLLLAGLGDRPVNPMLAERMARMRARPSARPTPQAYAAARARIAALS